MKTKHLLIAVVPLLLLTACKSINYPPPGNEISALLMQPEFKEVAAKHPAFADHVLRTVGRLELEQAWANHGKMEAIKARYQKMPRPAPIPLPPAPAKP